MADVRVHGLQYMFVAGMTSLAIAQMIEDAEAAAYADQHAAAPPEWKCAAEQTSAGWFLIAPRLDMLLFNRLVGWGLNRPARRNDVEAALERFGSAGLAHYGVQLSPLAKPGNFAEWLGAAGLVRDDCWSKVYRKAGDVPAVATALRVEETGARDAGSAASIACTAFGMPSHLAPWIASIVGRPGWHHYLAFDEAEPVATAALFVRGDIGWLGIAGTLPTARRRGAQGALMARRLSDGRALGCRWFVTETGEDRPDRPNPSFHNMMRLGFELAYQRPNYLLKSLRPESGSGEAPRIDRR
jgi:hypothetical protein